MAQVIFSKHTIWIRCTYVPFHHCKISVCSKLHLPCTGFILSLCPGILSLQLNIEQETINGRGVDASKKSQRNGVINSYLRLEIIKVIIG